MTNSIVAVSQFDGTVKLLTIDLSTGERQVISADVVNEDDITFGLFEVEQSEAELNSVALLATPEGPLLFLKDIRYQPDIKKTKIKIEDNGDFLHFQILHEENHVFGLFYEEKFGIGLHPYNTSREDIDFYYWLCKKINMPQFYQTYTKDIKYVRSDK